MRGACSAITIVRQIHEQRRGSPSGDKVHCDTPTAVEPRTPFGQTTWGRAPASAYRGAFVRRTVPFASLCVHQANDLNHGPFSTDILQHIVRRVETGPRRT